ncbi:MAG: Asp-tRNA(Asn)/Glu-tRNA(Gln) amidotransferase GatCAB subunit C, partial [Candidatus Kuenenia stuttgartiensis]
IAPLIHPFNITNIFREDTLEESIRREKALSLAPATEGFFFKVPKVLE